MCQASDPAAIVGVSTWLTTIVSAIAKWIDASAPTIHLISRYPLTGSTDSAALAGTGIFVFVLFILAPWVVVANLPKGPDFHPQTQVHFSPQFFCPSKGLVFAPAFTILA